MAVEHELVLTADEVAEGDVCRVVAGAGHQHLLAVLGLADVERRGGQVDEQRRPREREVGRRRPRLPDVLADREAEQRLAELEQDELPSGGEVPVLVEHPVVRQEVLPVDALDLALGADEGRIREVTVERRCSDEDDGVRGRARHLVDRLARGVDEPGAQEQILRRVAGDGQLGQHDDVGGGSCRLPDRGHDPLDVPVEVAHDDVELRERDPHLRILAAAGTGPQPTRFSTHDHKRHSSDVRSGSPRGSARRQSVEGAEPVAFQWTITGVSRS